MAAAGWRPTVGNYLGQVTKARILEAVHEGAGSAAAQLIDHLKKGEIAREAERLLAESGWLAEPLRLAGSAGVGSIHDAADSDGDAALPAFLADGVNEDEEAAEESDGDDEPMIAAE